MIKVTIPVPADVVVKAGEVLNVYRINYNGTYTACKTTVNNDGTLTFETDHFSTFVIVAEKAPATTAPVTGDASNIALWASMLGLGVVAVAASVVMKKRTF